MSLLDFVNEIDAHQLRCIPESGLHKNPPAFKPLVSAKQAKNLSIESKNRKNIFIRKINEKYKLRNDVHVSDIKPNEEEEENGEQKNLTQADKDLKDIHFLYESMAVKTEIDEYQPDENKKKVFTWRFGDNYEEEDDPEEDNQSIEIDYPGADDFDPYDLDTY